eukprot:12717454-Ditylum_brightwellii.AAC.1
MEDMYAALEMTRGRRVGGQAGKMLTQCVKPLEKKSILIGWIKINFPNSMGGLDSYSDKFLDDTPSYSKFLKNVSTTEADLIAQNAT